jgi:hypothetical protein
MSREHWWRIGTGENLIIWAKNFSSPTLSTTTPTLTGLGLNPRLCDEGSASNLVSHGTAHSPVVHMGKVKMQLLCTQSTHMEEWKSSSTHS